MSRGFFLTTRGITSHPLFRKNPNRLAVWMWLLDNAAFKETTHDVQGTVITVPRGAVCASTRQIADEVGVGHQVVRTAIERFKTQHMVNTDVTHGKTIITLCNYEKHQAPERSSNTPDNTAATQQQHSANTQKEQGNKENKRVSNETLARDTLAAAVSQQVAEDFIAHRKAMKKPVTEKAAQAIVKKLDGHPDPDAVLTDSIANGWQGIFPEKTKPSFTAINGDGYGRSPQSASKSERFLTSFVGGARGSS